MTKDPERRRRQQAAAQRRYEQTAKGKAAKKRYLDKRIFLGRNRCVGIAATIDEARAINAYIKQRREGYVAQQRQSARAEVESVSTGAVSVEAAV